MGKNKNDKKKPTSKKQIVLPSIVKIPEGEVCQPETPMGFSYEESLDYALQTNDFDRFRTIIKNCEADGVFPQNWDDKKSEITDFLKNQLEMVISNDISANVQLLISWIEKSIVPQFNDIQLILEEKTCDVAFWFRERYLLTNILKSDKILLYPEKCFVKMITDGEIEEFKKLYTLMESGYKIAFINHIINKDTVSLDLLNELVSSDYINQVYLTYLFLYIYIISNRTGKVIEFLQQILPNIDVNMIYYKKYYLLCSTDFKIISDVLDGSIRTRKNNYLLPNMFDDFDDDDDEDGPRTLLDFIFFINYNSLIFDMIISNKKLDINFDGNFLVFLSAIKLRDSYTVSNFLNRSDFNVSFNRNEALKLAYKLADKITIRQIENHNNYIPEEDFVAILDKKEIKSKEPFQSP